MKKDRFVLVQGYRHAYHSHVDPLLWAGGKNRASWDSRDSRTEEHYGIAGIVGPRSIMG